MLDPALGFPQEAIHHYQDGWTEEQIRQKAADPRQILLMATDSDAPIGLLLGTAPEGGVATIIWLLVDSDSRRQGIGGLLFREACREYKSMGCHKLKLTAPTKQAVAFYTKQGMACEGVHPDHWWRMDFWSMGISLDD